MGIRCPCGWHGELDERVPASADWLAQNDVDEVHFTHNALNCPECGESSGWVLTGEDAEFEDGEFDDDQ